MRAGNPVRPPLIYEPLFGLFFIAELFDDLDEGYAFSVGLAWARYLYH